MWSIDICLFLVKGILFNTKGDFYENTLFLYWSKMFLWRFNKDAYVLSETVCGKYSREF